MLPDLVRNEMDYTGFLIYWRKFCGADFLNGDFNKLKIPCFTFERKMMSDIQGKFLSAPGRSAPI